MLTTCPHCKNKVLTNSENICPSCKNDVSVFTEDQLLHEKVTIKISQKLPEICFHCGNTADKILILNYKKKQLDRISPSPVLLLFSWPMYLIATIWQNITSINKLKFFVPICKNCFKKTEPAKRAHVDFDKERLEIIAQKNFINSITILKTNQNEI